MDDELGHMWGVPSAPAPASRLLLFLSTPDCFRETEASGADVEADAFRAAARFGSGIGSPPSGSNPLSEDLRMPNFQSLKFHIPSCQMRHARHTHPGGAAARASCFLACSSFFSAKTLCLFYRTNLPNQSAAL